MTNNLICKKSFFLSISLFFYVLKVLLILTCVFIFSEKSFCQKNEPIIISKDVLHFWQAFDSLNDHSDTTAIFQKYVLDSATNEFKVFIKGWEIKASDYTSQVKRYPEFYRTIRSNALYLISNQNQIIAVIDRFKRLYPNYIDAQICIALGNFRTGGTISRSLENSMKRNYVYIGLEYHGLDSSTYIKELPKATQDYVSRSNFYRTIIHELVHIQQMNHGKKIAEVFQGRQLSSAILKEGVADFIGKLVYPAGNNGSNFEYGLQNEDQLKIKLQNELYGLNYSEWIYNTGFDKPQDLGYFMGSRIAESYYNKFSGHKNIIKELIEIRNPKDFIKKSYYFN